MSRFLVVSIVAGAAWLAHAQSSPLASSHCNNCGPRTQQPYTAAFKITQVQTLANGTAITRESTEIDARDSQGQSLHSTTELTPMEGRIAGTTAHVNDSAGGINASWDSRTKKATVIKLPPQDQRQGCWASDSGTMRMSWYEGPRPGKPAPNGVTVTSSNGGGGGGNGTTGVTMASSNAGGGVGTGVVGAGADSVTIVPAPRHKPVMDDLGTSTIEGFEVLGRRFTTTIPQGEVGNDRPLVSVREIWTSPQFGIPLREVTDDPRSGKRTREITSLTLAEPDPSLFQPPEGYEVTTDELHQVPCSPPQ